MRTQLVAAMIAAVLACCATAHATIWTGLGDGLRWDDPANWNGGLPFSGTGNSSRAFINDTSGGPATILIDSATTAATGRMLMSDALESNVTTLNMTGGTLTVAKDITGGNNEKSLAIGSNGKTTFNLSGGVVNVYGRIRMGVFNFPNAEGILNVSGGELHVNPPNVAGVDNEIGMGNQPMITKQQQLNVSGGIVTAHNLNLDGNVPSPDGTPMALVKMTGGSITVGNVAVPYSFGVNGLNAHVQLDGGTLTVTNVSIDNKVDGATGLRLGNGPGDVALGQDGNIVKGTLDITAGTLVLAGDVTTIVTKYVAVDHSLSAYGGTGIVNRNFDATNPGNTTVTASILGDANRDAVVDIFDINMISANWGAPAPVGGRPGPNGDVNGDHAVDIFDINAVSAHWGQTNPDGPTMGLAATNAVPEPASIVTLAIGALFLGVRIGHRRSVRSKVA